MAKPSPADYPATSGNTTSTPAMTQTLDPASSQTRPDEPEFEPVERIEGSAGSHLLFLCDHASNALPPGYGTLGMDASQFERHIAFDPGAAAVTRALASHFNAPAVLARFSRLLIDPNRGEDDPTLVMRLYDGTVVPANRGITRDGIAERLERLYRPYHAAYARLAAAHAKLLEEEFKPATTG